MILNILYLVYILLPITINKSCKWEGDQLDTHQLSVLTVKYYHQCLIIRRLWSLNLKLNINKHYLVFGWEWNKTLRNKELSLTFLWVWCCKILFIWIISYFLLCAIFRIINNLNMTGFSLSSARSFAIFTICPDMDNRNLVVMSLAPISPL